MLQELIKTMKELLNELKNDRALKTQKIKDLEAEIANKDQKILQLEDELSKAKEETNKINAEELEQLEKAIAELKAMIMQ